MALCENRTSLGITMNDPIILDSGQRRCGPPTNWIGIPPTKGCEVFVAKIPKDCFEINLIPILKNVGEIYMFRLMMEDEFNHRGFGFCTYVTKSSAKEAVETLNNYQIKNSWFLGICFSVDNCRLFVGGIPKMKIKSEIFEEMKKVTENVVDIIMYPSAADKNKNRGFAFVEYTDHKSAAIARKIMIGSGIQLWGHNVAVDWAEPEKNVDEDTMSKVKILYVRNLMLTTSEGTIYKTFSKFTNDKNEINRVKKIGDFAFVHFQNRDQAEIAKLNLHGSDLEGSIIEVHFAKPANKADQHHKLIKKYKNSIEKPTSTTLTRELKKLSFECGYNDLIKPTSPETNGVIKSYRNAAGRCNTKERDYVKIIGTKQEGCIGNFVELLSHLCQSYGWDMPCYTVQIITMIQESNIPLFVAQVYIPGFNLQFTSKVPSITYKEAISDASESALMWLFYNGFQIPILFANENFNEKDYNSFINNKPQMLPINLSPSITSQLFNNKTIQPLETYASQYLQYSSIPSCYNKYYNPHSSNSLGKEAIDVEDGKRNKIPNIEDNKR